MQRSLASSALLFALVAGCGSDGNSGQEGTGGAGGMGGMGGAGGGPSVPAATFADIYAMAFVETTNARCNFCHSMPATENGNGKLHMGSDQATAYGALVGKMSASTHCMGRTLVVPGHPEMSLLLQKLSASPPCGNRMPLGGKVFTDAQLEMVRSWIAAGANP